MDPSSGCKPQGDSGWALDLGLFVSWLVFEQPNDVQENIVRVGLSKAGVFLSACMALLAALLSLGQQEVD